MSPRTDTVEAEFEAAVELEAETSENGESEPESDKHPIGFSVPNELYDLVKSTADAQDKSVAGLARELLASHFNFVLPPSTQGRKAKYDNDADREAAKKASYEKRQKTLKALMEMYNRGEIVIPNSLD